MERISQTAVTGSRGEISANSEATPSNAGDCATAVAVRALWPDRMKAITTGSARTSRSATVSAVDSRSAPARPVSESWMTASRRPAAAAPATAAIMNDSPADNHGVSAAVNDAAREIGAAIGIAISGTVLASGYRAGIDPVLPRLPEPVRGPVSHSLAATTEFEGPAEAFDRAFWCATVLPAPAIPVCLLLPACAPVPHRMPEPSAE